MVKQAVVAVMVCVIAYVVVGYVGQVYAQNEAHRIGRVIAENKAYNDSVEKATDRTIVLPEKDFEHAELSDAEYAIIDSMYTEAMRARDLNEDFERAFPVEYKIMMRDGKKHDCVDCRLKAIAAAYWDAEWSDCFDSDNGIAAEFEHVLDTNKSVRAEFNELLHACWGENSGLDD